MRRFVWFEALLLFLATVTLPALRTTGQPKEPAARPSLTVSTDRADALYRKGETVRFAVRLQGPGSSENDTLHWTISKDGVPPIKTGQAKLQSGSAELTAQLDDPGFLHCRVTWRTADGKTVTALAGAGVEPLEIRPSLPVPDDFDGFWASQKEQLAQIPVKGRLTAVESPQPGVECFDLQVDCVGPPVAGYLARPKGAVPKSLPIILTLHGAGVRSAGLGSAAGWAAQSFLALDINAHGLPNGRPAAFYEKLASDELKDYRGRGRQSRETIYFLGMFLRLVRAIDFLSEQPEWNGRALVVYGSSQGGAQAIAAAGLDPRVTFFAAGVPAMCDHTGIVVGRTNGWPKFIPNNPEERPDPQVIQAVRYYDAMNFATRTKAAGIVTVGFVDTTCPPTSVYAAYNQIPGKKEIFNDPSSGHTVSPLAGGAMRAAVLRHISSLR